MYLLEFINKKLKECDEQMIMCTPCMSIIIYVNFLRNYRQWKKLKKGDVIDDNVYILYVKRIVFKDL